MLKKLLIIVFGILLFSCVNKNPKTQTQRIISMAPNITEILFTLGLQDRIVAVSDFCTFPDEALEKESIGGLFNPNLEKITALKPDLILATESYQNLAEKLGKGDLKIVLLPEKTVDDIYFVIDSIGVLTNTSDKATSLVKSIKDSLEFYKAKPDQNRPSAILVLGRDAGTTRNIGISGPGAFINELWVWSGGNNAFPEIATSFVQVNREDLLTVDPEIIIEFKPNKNWSLEQENLNKTEWNNLKISAVKNSNIFIIQGEKFLIPGPRMYILAKRYRQIITKFQSQRFD